MADGAAFALEHLCKAFYPYFSAFIKYYVTIFFLLQLQGIHQTYWHMKLLLLLGKCKTLMLFHH
jgi:hypothetical protein